MNTWKKIISTLIKKSNRKMVIVILALSVSLAGASFGTECEGIGQSVRHDLKKGASYIVSEDDPTNLSVKKGDEIEATFIVKETGPSSGTPFVPFTAYLCSYGGFWGWDATTPTESGEWSVRVTKPGEYTLRLTAPCDWDFSGLFCVQTDLSSMPESYDIWGKTIKFGEKEYDWSRAELFEDVGNIRLSIWNEWGKDEDGSWDVKYNPLAFKRTRTAVSVKAGDEVEATFSVVKDSAASDIETPDFTAGLVSFGSIWGWDDTHMPEHFSESEGDWKAKVSGCGDYTVRGIASMDADGVNDSLQIVTDLKEMPKGYHVVGKTIKVAGEEYDWRAADLYEDGLYIRLSVWNGYANGYYYYNNPIPLRNISKGDKLSVTFEVVARDGTAKFTPFTASLHSYGGFWGWDASTGTDSTWKVEVKKPGKYTIEVVAPNDSLKFPEGALCVETDLETMPSDYDIVGETLRLGYGLYDLSSAKGYVVNEHVRLSVWNEWGAENDVLANPLKYAGKETVPTGTPSPTSSPSPVPSPSVAPTITPSNSPTVIPTIKPSSSPTAVPTMKPNSSFAVSPSPSAEASIRPSTSPTGVKRHQSITAASYVKTYGSKAFMLNAKSSGNGSLSYGGANKKIAIVSRSGKATIKGYGKTFVTITASGTDDYYGAVKKISITVIPQKAVITRLASRKRSLLTCKIKTQKKVTGYEFVVTAPNGVQKIIKKKKPTLTAKYLSGKKYKVKVRAYKKVGKKLYRGAWSKQRTVKTK